MNPETLLPKIVRVLRRHHGPENAISVRDLTRAIGLPVTQERSVRRILRTHLAVIWTVHQLKIISGRHGYFLGSDAEQYQRAYNYAMATGLQHTAYADAIRRLCKADGIHIAPAK